MEAYGQQLQVFDGSMCANVEGRGQTTLVLLHGAGIASPVLELRPLAHQLARWYTVVTLEYFGYGLSSDTKRPRTIENISEEIHCVLQKLGVARFVLVAHSISGVYGLYYANRYPEEVEAFIGIDSSVARQNEYLNTDKISIAALHLQKFLARTGLLALLDKLMPNLLVPQATGYHRSSDERALLRRLSLENAARPLLLDELKNGLSNFEKTAGMQWKNVPVLFFLASNSIRQIAPWVDLHRELADNDTPCEVVVLTGSHFLYNQHAHAIAEKTNEYLGRRLCADHHTKTTMEAAKWSNPL